MNPVRAARLEKILVLLLVAGFALPVPLGLWLLIPANKTPATVWLRNRTLSGIQIKPKAVALSRASLLSSRYQAFLAQFYDLHFAGRELLIRVLDEVYLHAFHTMPSGQIVGPRLSLIEPAYTEEYCLRRGDDQALRSLAGDLRTMQDFCAARGIPFALVITPSKAAIYPEELPANWLRLYQSAPRYYDLFLPLLQEKGIHYVDGHRLAVEMKPTAKTPLFPLGGIHWSDPLALATANGLLEMLARQGFGVQPIHDYRTRYSNDPKDQDCDLANLVNNVSAWHYPVATVTVQPTAGQNPYHPNLVAVGGSFTWKLLELLDVSRQFSELECYFYYTAYKSSILNGERHTITKPTAPLNFETEVFAADALVLEVNEQTLYTPALHLTSFLHDALAVLPDPHAAKAPFHYESRVQYQWGKILSFVRGNDPIDPAATSGFDTPDERGSNIFGSSPSLRFTAPPAPRDMTLEIVAGAYYIGRNLPAQQVGVSVNGHPVGDWTWNAVADSNRRLTIPKGFLPGGEVALEFHVAHPISAAELGAGRDERKMGIHIASLRLHEAEEGK